VRLTQTRLPVRDYAASLRSWRDTIGLTASFGEGAECETYPDEMDKAIGRAASEEQGGSDLVVVALDFGDPDDHLIELYTPLESEPA
jgi:catechol 2,3-dioxygenase-like lactoylglutathione lyase family enzyme